MSFGVLWRRKFFWVVLVLLLLLLFFFPHFVLAQGIEETLSKFFRAILGRVLWASSYLTGIGQMLFLEVINFTILDFAKAWKGGLASNFSVVWQILRDLVNLVIVVVFVLTAVVTVFGEKAFGVNRKSLLYLIYAAIFVNFSAFFTLLIIDISHIAFMLFFNALPLEGFGSLSPFSGYDGVLSSIGNFGFTFIVALMGIVVNWFVMLGFLYFSIILIERYIIAMFLVLLSPIAALGFFGKQSDGNTLIKQVSSFYDKWAERLKYVFSTPVVLVLGFVLLTALVRGTLGKATDPSNFVQLLGLDSDEGRELMITLLLGSIVLIYGIFKVGNIAKNANILSDKGIGKFKFGEFMQKRALNFAKGKWAQGGFLNTLGKIPLGDRNDGDRKVKDVNAWLKKTPILRGLSGQGKKFSDPESGVGTAARRLGGIISGVDSGKIVKDPTKVYKEFKEVYDGFSKIKDEDGAMADWSDGRRRDYYRINDTLTRFMEDDDENTKRRRQLAASGKSDPWLSSQTRQMKDFLSGGKGGNSNNSSQDAGESGGGGEIVGSGGSGGGASSPDPTNTPDGGSDPEGGGETNTSEKKQTSYDDFKKAQSEAEALRTELADMKQAGHYSKGTIDRKERDLEFKEKDLSAMRSPIINKREEIEKQREKVENTDSFNSSKFEERAEKEKLETLEKELADLQSSSETDDNSKPEKTGVSGTKSAQERKVSESALNSLSQNKMDEIKNDVAQLRNTLKDRWNDEDADLQERISKLEGGGGSDTEDEELEKQREEIREGIAEIKKNRETAGKINKDNETVLKKGGDSTDEQKKEVIKNSIEFAKDFVQEGTQHLDKNLKSIDEKLLLYRTTIPDEKERNSDDTYADLKKERKRLADRRRDVRRLNTSIGDILESAEE